MPHNKMEFDVIIVGAGPAGLATAIQLAKLNQTHQTSFSIGVLEKGATVGAHILSGAVLEPHSFQTLIPDWQQKKAPLLTPVTQDQFLLFTEKKSFRLPTPPQMHNQGNYIISLGELCRFLAKEAEELGVNIFPGFAATEILYDGDTVVGVATGDKGLDKMGKPTSRFQAGMHLLAKHTVFAEGCRGFLTERLIERFQLRQHPQTYGLGLKEIWEIPDALHQRGLVMHSIGWPLDTKTYGGSFVYHGENNQILIGFVVGLDYQNTYLNPYEEFQRFKMHPTIYPLLEKGKRIAYGARSLNEGGFQAIPRLTVKGGSIVGCAAGFLNVPKIKGIHNAIQSGVIAAENLFPLLQQPERAECIAYSTQLKQNPLWDELYHARNIRPAMNWGLWPGLAYAALDTYLFRGKAPWTLSNHVDHLQLNPARDCQKINYPKHDNHVTFDLMNSVFLTHSYHDENQPCHLKLKNATTPITINLKVYDAPEQRYCPAGVYEIIDNADKQPHLQINAPNCIHCKACDIKDPTQNIVWTPPEGGSGPQYEAM